MMREMKQVDTADVYTEYTQQSSTETTVENSIPGEEQAVGSDETVLLPDSLLELEALIAERAYEFYENRGQQDGHDLDDWLEAERQILAQFGPSS
jgi:hypothetical protein